VMVSKSTDSVSERDLFLGCDPGAASGGLAILDAHGQIVDASAMPATERDIAQYLEEFQPRIRKAFIEAVHAFPGQGVASQFVFGQHYGLLRGLLIALKIPFEQVSPQRWKRTLGLTSDAADSKLQKKNKSKQLAGQLWPDYRATHATAEALLIAEVCRRAHGNGNNG